MPASHHYIWTVPKHLLPFAHLHYGNEFVFIQVNASIHASKETKAFFKEMGMMLLDWFARSRDLNPIENIKTAVMLAWDSPTTAEMNGLLDTSGKCCFEVAKKLGDKAHY
ncbi:Transposable element [Phytophthora megakarya]|uniref:Transposable element n=1 Tax=Phytophthora megakarya TaxID=4795 RepID=A0A225VKJ5_9STRA|nr:Transposable element [Phytophthora megakarya]